MAESKNERKMRSLKKRGSSSWSLQKDPWRQEDGAGVQELDFRSPTPSALLLPHLDASQMTLFLLVLGLPMSGMGESIPVQPTQNHE